MTWVFVTSLLFAGRSSAGRGVLRLSTSSAERPFEQYCRMRRRRTWQTRLPFTSVSEEEFFFPDWRSSASRPADGEAKVYACILGAVEQRLSPVGYPLQYLKKKASKSMPFDAEVQETVIRGSGFVHEGQSPIDQSSRYFDLRHEQAVVTADCSARLPPFERRWIAEPPQTR